MPIQKRSNYFDDDEESDTPPAKDGKKAGAMLPRSVLGGKAIEVGDRITLEVTGIHDDELAVAYASAKPDKEPETDTEAEPESEPGDGAAPPEEMGETEPEEADLYA